MPTDTAPAFRIVGDDTEPSDAAVSALARLLLAADDTNTHNTPPPAAAVASVSIFAANKELD